MSDDACRFCRESDDVALDEHHIVPKSFVGNDADTDREIVGKTVTLCSNCHRKYHALLDPVIEYVGERFRERMNHNQTDTDFKTASEVADD